MFQEVIHIAVVHNIIDANDMYINGQQIDSKWPSVKNVVWLSVASSSD